MYQPDSEVRLEVRLEEETVWLNRQQLSELGMATVANFATVQKEGDRIVTRQVEYYNLDMVLSVGYRVKSNRGVEFRRWANKVLKEYVLKGHVINYRLEQMDTRLQKHERQIEYLTDKVDFFVRTSLPPMEGVFYDGQIFDAYKFTADLIRSARQSIVLIDNYVDESVLLMLSKRNAGVKADIPATVITALL